MLNVLADTDDDLDLESGSHYVEVHDERDVPSEGIVGFLVVELCSTLRQLQLFLAHQFFIALTC